MTATSNSMHLSFTPWASSLLSPCVLCAHCIRCRFTRSSAGQFATLFINLAALPPSDAVVVFHVSSTVRSCICFLQFAQCRIAVAGNFINTSSMRRRIQRMTSNTSSMRRRTRTKDIKHVINEVENNNERY